MWYALINFSFSLSPNLSLIACLIMLYALVIFAFLLIHWEVGTILYIKVSVFVFKV